MRFLHIADAHLDTSFSGRSESIRRRLRAASREAFERAVDVAVREDVHALLVAGDLFDGDRLSFQTERFLLDQTRRLSDHGITVVYATGNHDPGAPGSGPRALSWPSNVRLAPDGTPRRFLVPDHAGEAVGYVTAIGHDRADVSTDLSRLLPRPDGTLPEVALLHTQVRSSIGSGDHHAYAPSELTYLRHAGFDYWALGHVHVRQSLSEDPPIWYPGSLQGKSHSDVGERGGLLVDLSDRAAPAVSFRSLAPVRWDTLEVGRLEAVSSLDELERAVQLAWTRRRHEDGGPTGTDEWMIRVVPTGPCPLWSELRAAENLATLADELRELLGALDVTVEAAGVHPVFPLEEHRGRTDVLGEALRFVEGLRNGEREPPPVDASTLAGAPSDDPREIAAYVRTLLSDVDGEIAARLLEDPSS